MKDKEENSGEDRPKRANRKGLGVDGLTPKQRAFVAARAAGGSRSDAYRMAYSPTAKPTTAGAGGARLDQNKAVATVLERVRQEMEIGQIWDARRVRAWVHSQLLLEATTATSPAARVKALELLGKNAGMFTGAKDAPIATSASDLRARLKAKLLELQGDTVSGADPDSASGAEPQGADKTPDGTGEPP